MRKLIALASLGIIAGCGAHASNVSGGTVALTPTSTLITCAPVGHSGLNCVFTVSADGSTPEGTVSVHVTGPGVKDNFRPELLNGHTVAGFPASQGTYHITATYNGSASERSSTDAVAINMP